MRYNQLIFLMSLDWPHSNLSPSERASRIKKINWLYKVLQF
jgi:hypothetical protein